MSSFLFRGSFDFCDTQKSQKKLKKIMLSNQMGFNVDDKINGDKGFHPIPFPTQPELQFATQIPHDASDYEVGENNEVIDLTKEEPRSEDEEPTTSDEEFIDDEPNIAKISSDWEAAYNAQSSDYIYVFCADCLKAETCGPEWEKADTICRNCGSKYLTRQLLKVSQQTD